MQMAEPGQIGVPLGNPTESDWSGSWARQSANVGSIAYPGHAALRGSARLVYRNQSAPSTFDPWLTVTKL